MAGWGSGSFDNEDAQGWLKQLPELTADDLQQLLARVDDDGYLEASESGVIVAAAEAVAALKGEPPEGAPLAIVDWASKTNTESLADLAALAIRAVQRVRTNSELKDLWLEADGLNEWSANLRSLEQRLAGSAHGASPAVRQIKAPVMTDARSLLRHTLATLAYRGGKAVRNAPATFAGYRGGESSRTPAEILAHIGDLLDWGLSIAEGEQRWNNSSPLPWEKEVDRFHAALKKFDDYLASEAPLHVSPEKLFQGPVADALTHVGQINMLRRLAAAPVKGENYFVAEITEGKVGPDQSAPRKEFD